MKEMLLNAVAYTAELDLSDIGKGTYPYYMLKEIDEQPTVMRKLDSKPTQMTKGQCHCRCQLLSRQYKKQIVSTSLAAGTSYHAGFASKKLCLKN